MDSPLPQELRLLMFSDEELAQAVVLYLRRQGLSLAQGRVTILSKSGHPRVQLTYAIGIGEGSEVHELGGEALAGALVLYCVERAIPMRRDAQKILHLMDGHIVFILNGNFPTSAVLRLFKPDDPDPVSRR